MKQPIHKMGLWNPYVAGIVLGLVLTAAFYVMGVGLGASGMTSRTTAVITHAAAPDTVETNGYLKRYYQPGDKYPLINWVVFQVIGLLIGGTIGSLTGKRFNLSVSRGPNASVGMRLGLACLGGILVGLSSRLARGCTSGQALSGGATMVVGSWVFMLALFATAFIAAMWVRRQWL
jgi:uncharacterized membrane protein YedE/YeeE